MCTKAFNIAKNVECPPGANFIPIQTEMSWRSLLKKEKYLRSTWTYHWMASRRDVSRGALKRADSSFSARRTKCRRTRWILRCNTTSTFPPSGVPSACNPQVDTCSCSPATSRFGDTAKKIYILFILFQANQDFCQITHFIEYPRTKYCLKQIIID